MSHADDPGPDPEFFDAAAEAAARATGFDAHQHRWARALAAEVGREEARAQLLACLDTPLADLDPRCRRAFAARYRRKLDGWLDTPLLTLVTD